MTFLGGMLHDEYSGDCVTHPRHCLQAETPSLQVSDTSGSHRVALGRPRQDFWEFHRDRRGWNGDCRSLATVGWRISPRRVSSSPLELADAGYGSRPLPAGQVFWPSVSPFACCPAIEDSLLDASRRRNFVGSATGRLSRTRSGRT